MVAETLQINRLINREGTRENFRPELSNTAARTIKDQTEALGTIF